jgi:hypothetical protein
MSEKILLAVHPQLPFYSATALKKKLPQVRRLARKHKEVITLCSARHDAPFMDGKVVYTDTGSLASWAVNQEIFWPYFAPGKLDALSFTVVGGDFSNCMANAVYSVLRCFFHNIGAVKGTKPIWSAKTSTGLVPRMYLPYRYCFDSVDKHPWCVSRDFQHRDMSSISVQSLLGLMVMPIRVDIQRSRVVIRLSRKNGISVQGKLVYTDREVEDMLKPLGHYWGWDRKERDKNLADIVRKHKINFWK